MKSSFLATGLMATAMLAATPAVAGSVNVMANGQTFAFSPSVVTLKKGVPTTIHFKATPGAPHGLSVPEIGLKNTVITSAGTSATVTPKKAGTFTAHCTIVCGAGHAHMAMKFVVK
jgi:cytochrome c oxidase subunit 2